MDVDCSPKVGADRDKVQSAKFRTNVLVGASTLKPGTPKNSYADVNDALSNFCMPHVRTCIIDGF